jgi:hypothetical protein
MARLTATSAKQVATDLLIISLAVFRRKLPPAVDNVSSVLTAGRRCRQSTRAQSRRLVVGAQLWQTPEML